MCNRIWNYYLAGEPEVAEVAGREEHVGLEELAQAAHLGPEGERGVEVEAGRPEQAAEQEVD